MDSIPGTGTMDVVTLTKHDDGTYAIEIGRVHNDDGTQEPGQVIEFARKQDVEQFAFNFQQELERQLAAI